jgi:Tfp pilus assembly protein PilV
MLIELLISMVVLLVGLGGMLIMLVSAMYTNTKAGNDTTSTMVAEHVLEQISAQPANAIDNLSITDCAGNLLDIATVGAVKGAGSGANGGNGAALTAAGQVDWTQAAGGIPAGYNIQYVACGNANRRTTYDVRWNVMTMSAYTRMVVISARPSTSTMSGGLRFVVPANLRTIGGM